MIKTANASKVIGLLLVLMAAMVVLSGPVAGVLDLPEPTAEAKKKHKKKKKKKRPPVPAYNVVQCPNTSNNNYDCVGTPGNDYLVGGPADRSPEGAYDDIKGGEGNDVYNGGDGADALYDYSTTSNDYYLLPSTEFSLYNGRPSSTNIYESGGSADVLDLGFYKSTDFTRSRESGFDLLLDGPGDRLIVVKKFFTVVNTMDYFRFSDGTIPADEIKKEFPEVPASE